MYPGGFEMTACLENEVGCIYLGFILRQLKHKESSGREQELLRKGEWMLGVAGWGSTLPEHEDHTGKVSGYLVATWRAGATPGWPGELGRKAGSSVEKGL